MSRRWIHNDAACSIQPDADAGFEVEVVSAGDYDAVSRRLRAAEVILNRLMATWSDSPSDYAGLVDALDPVVYECEKWLKEKP